MPSSKSLLLVLLCVCGLVMPRLARAQAFQDGSFEAQVAGTGFSPPWGEAGGTGSAIEAAPANGFPTSGSKHARIDATGTGPYSAGCLSLPNVTGAWITQSFGNCLNVLSIGFDWTWICAETANATLYNDFFAVRLHTQTGALIATLLYVDTRDGTGIAPACASAGVALPISFANGSGAAMAGEVLPAGPKHVTFALANAPAYSPGTPVRLVAVCGNGFDNSMQSIARIDSITVTSVPAGGGGQANTAAARLEINGAGSGVCGGPFNVQLSAGIPLSLFWQGPPLMPIVLLAAGPSQASVPVSCVGLIDIGTPPGFGDVAVVFDGTLPDFPNPLFRLGPTGTAGQTFTLPSLPPGVFVASLQGVVYQPAASPCGLLVTAAFNVTTQ